MTEQEFSDAMDELHEAYVNAWQDPEERAQIIQAAKNLAVQYDTQIESERLEEVYYTQLPDDSEVGWNRLTGGPFNG